MRDSEFSRALFVRPGRIAGLRLRPFSLWHSFALDFLDSPFVGGSDPCTLGHCLAALPVLASDYASGLPFPSAIARFRLALRITASGTERTVAAIDAHIAAYSGYPETWKKPAAGPSSRSGAPWQWYVVAVLMQDYSMTLADAWNTPCIAAAVLKAIAVERTGGDAIMALSEIDAIEARRGNG